MAAEVQLRAQILSDVMRRWEEYFEEVKSRGEMGACSGVTQMHCG
jgi:hydrogenase maturation factor